MCVCVCGGGGGGGGGGQSLSLVPGITPLVIPGNSRGQACNWGTDDESGEGGGIGDKCLLGLQRPIPAQGCNGSDLSFVFR